jgi:hypothetical protein
LQQTGAPEGRIATNAYADRLATMKPADPLAGHYYEKKITEARGSTE